MSSAKEEHVVHLQTASRERLLAAIGKYNPNDLIAIARAAGIIATEDYDYVNSSACSDDDRSAVRSETIRQIEDMLEQAAHWISKAMELGSGIAGSLLQSAIVHYDKAQQALAELRRRPVK